MKYVDNDDDLKEDRHFVVKKFFPIPPKAS